MFSTGFFITYVIGITIIAAYWTLKARKALLLAAAISLMVWSFIVLISTTNLPMLSSAWLLDKRYVFK
jgi:hypothetical protein